MAGISAKAAGSLENKYKFNSSSELNNDLDISLYETPLRGYDAQIGRFGGIDILAESYHSYSGYAFVTNNPVVFSDPSGARLENLHQEEKRQSFWNDARNRYFTMGYLNSKLERNKTDWSSSDANFGGGTNGGGGGSNYSGINAQVLIFGIQKGSIGINDATKGIVITTDMVSTYLQSQHPDWQKIEVEGTSGYSKNGEGFRYSASINDKTKSAAGNEVILGFLSVGTAQKLLNEWNKSDPYVAGGIEFLGLGLTAQSAVESIIKYTPGVEAETKALVGLKAARNFTNIGYGFAIIGASAAITNYIVGNTNGLHTTLNVIAAGAGLLPGIGPAISLAWGMTDSIFGENIESGTKAILNLFSK